MSPSLIPRPAPPALSLSVHNAQSREDCSLVPSLSGRVCGLGTRLGGLGRSPSEPHIDVVNRIPSVAPVQFHKSYLTAGRARSARPAGPKIALRFRVCVCVFVHKYHVH